ncbi:hypothetical protein CI238_08150, partial [Colletotrichum incanum]
LQSNRACQNGIFPKKHHAPTRTRQARTGHLPFGAQSLPSAASPVSYLFISFRPPPTLQPSLLHPLTTHPHPATNQLHQHQNNPINFHHTQQSQWPALSRPPVSPLVARLPASSSPPRPPARAPPPPEVSRSLTATSLVPSLFVRSVVTRSPLSFSSASSPSSVWFVRSLRTSSPTSASSPPPSALCRSLSSPTSSPSLRTPTSVLSTPSVSPSSPRTSSLLAASVVSATKRLVFRFSLFMGGLRLAFGNA